MDTIEKKYCQFQRKQKKTMSAKLKQLKPTDVAKPDGTITNEQEQPQPKPPMGALLEGKMKKL
jgi:hypothetical protein